MGGEGEGTFIVMSHPGEWLHWRAATSIDSDRWLKCSALRFMISTLSIPAKKQHVFMEEQGKKTKAYTILPHVADWKMSCAFTLPCH